jgi:phosphohistidine swiveling domain-containing protein
MTRSEMSVIGLADVDAAMVDLVGGKAVGLAVLRRAGERVPDGFCITTNAYRAGRIPEDELLAAYARLGAGAVAVRSSATTEDSPGASFAGQQETVLGVTGAGDLVEAVRRCWDSLHAARAVAYRTARGLAEPLMGVVVQRMVDPLVAGVLFTADPVTGRRTEMVVDAAPGLGTAVVDGTTIADHYRLDPAGRPDRDGGCLAPSQLADLHAAGRRVQDRFGCPQDVEWAIDRDHTMWLLQSRPITTLFPVPPSGGRPEPRVYLELGGQFQGVLQPFTPMGVAVLKAVLARMPGGAGGLVDVAGRIYADVTDVVRRKGADRWLPRFAESDLGPRVRAVLEQVLADPRFAPVPGKRSGTGRGPVAAIRVAARAGFGILRALARPAAARGRAFEAVAALARRTATPRPGGPLDRLDRIERRAAPNPDQADDPARLDDMVWPLLAGILSAAAAAPLLKGVATEAEVRTVLGGMPHNVTIEMNLALWHLAVRARDHRDLLLETPAPELAARYHAGMLPELGLSRFLDEYGHRAAAEIDVGIPRWAEDPAPVFAAIANYLRLTDPEQAPDRRFQQAAAGGEAMLAELVRRARRRRPVRALMGGFFLRRARALGGLRELGKFAGLYTLRDIRRDLLLAGADLTARGLLASPDDIMFLDLREARTAVLDGADHRDLVTARRAAYDRELRRTHIPVALLSDGTDVEALAPPPAAAGTLIAMAAAPGRVTGPARVIHDPAGARIEPGEILVAPTTDPGWTPLFLTARGLVTEIGAPLAHGPTVAREYGIPAVIGVRDATRKIQTGQVITVDGAAGTVTMEDNHPG